MTVGRRFFFFAALSAALWLLLVPLYYAGFAWTEFVPGANWVYLPHGLRIVLVLLFGLAGAIGFTAGAAVLGLTILSLPTLSVSLDLMLASVPAVAAWLAVRWTVKDYPGWHIALSQVTRLQALDGRRLLLLAMVSAVLNAAGHALIWGIWAPEIAPAQERFFVMWVGDFLGALLLLYMLRGAALLVLKLSNRLKWYGDSAH